LDFEDFCTFFLFLLLRFDISPSSEPESPDDESEDEEEDVVELESESDDEEDDELEDDADRARRFFFSFFSFLRFSTPPMISMSGFSLTAGAMTFSSAANFSGRRLESRDEPGTKSSLIPKACLALSFLLS
jgi:hypothetical protein